MELKKVTIANSPNASSNIICYDNIDNHIVYMSLLGYDSVIKLMTKQANKRNVFYVNRTGSYITTHNACEIIKHKSQNSDYTHAIIYRKDRVVETRNKEEFLQAYIYTDLPNEFNLLTTVQNNQPIPDQLISKLYDKLYAHTPVPIIREWVPFIANTLIRTGRLVQMPCHKSDDLNFKVFRLSIMFKDLFSIVSSGLSNTAISIEGSNIPSEAIKEVTGLDSYLNSFTEILARKIQESFTPKFIPGEDDLSENLQVFDDYSTYKGLKMYEAQKAVAQSVSNNLDTNNVSFIIGEMGCGIGCI